MYTLFINYKWRRPGKDDMSVEHKSLSDVPRDHLKFAKDVLGTFAWNIRGTLEESENNNVEPRITYTILFIQGKSDKITGKSVTEFRDEFKKLVELIGQKQQDA